MKYKSVIYIISLIVLIFVLNTDKGLHHFSTFKIGTAIDTSKLANTSYQNIALKDFNRITPESALKFYQLSKSPSDYDWTQADLFVNFGIQNKLQMHGHVLIWQHPMYKTLPDWITNFKGSKEEWEKILENHIKKVLTRYKGKFESWDVVNEALNRDGKNWRNTLWYKNIGESYIEKAFFYANKYDPNALLFYNDYNLITNHKKLLRVLNHLDKLRAKGIRIDGLGIQGHLKTKDITSAKLVKAFSEVVSRNYKLHISELDIRKEDASEEKQAQKFKLVASLYKKIVPERLQYGITFWEFSDADNWINDKGLKDTPSLYNIDYQTKSTYHLFKQGLTSF